MIEYLKRYQGEHGEFSYVLETYSQAFDLLNAYRGDADLVFLDIRLPDQLGIFPFSYSLQRRRHFLLRLAVSLGGGMLAVEILTRLLFAQGLVAEFAVITMLYVLLNLIVWFCYKESAWTALFVTASGYVLQDMASGVKAALRYTLPTKLFADMTATTPGVFLFFKKSKLYKTKNIYKMKKEGQMEAPLRDFSGKPRQNVL